MNSDPSSSKALVSRLLCLKWIQQYTGYVSYPDLSTFSWLIFQFQKCYRSVCAESQWWNVCYSEIQWPPVEVFEESLSCVPEQGSWSPFLSTDNNRGNHPTMSISSWFPAICISQLNRYGWFHKTGYMTVTEIIRYWGNEASGQCHLWWGYGELSNTYNVNKILKCSFS